MNRLTQRLFPLIFLLISTQSLSAQDEAAIESIRASVQQPEVEQQIHFLASDEFMGRDTGSPHLEIAGKYIATWFDRYGIEPLPELGDYFQPIRFIRADTPEGGDLVVGDSTFTWQRDFVSLSPARAEAKGEFKVLDHGDESELREHDLEGKILIVRAGYEDSHSPQEWYDAAEGKRRAAEEQGAIALVELYESPMLPWQMLADFINQPVIEVDKRPDDGPDMIPHVWINSTGIDLYNAFSGMENDSAAVAVHGTDPERFTSRNVVGYIEGTDPDLADEYLLLGAHYDHVGIDEEAREAGGNFIYNGARDNATGTVGVMMAARYFAENPPRRPVIFAAWTAEEIGLYGSSYFADNPPVPLESIIYKLNIDSAGYNDTTKVMIIGKGRTDTDEQLARAAEGFGLETIPDPVPEQNLFERSDNAPFAVRGIPAPTWSLGLTSFDEEIERYYHTVKDEPHTLDYPYITDFIRSYLLAIQLIADREERPFWQEGDRFKELGLELYGMD